VTVRRTRIGLYALFTVAVVTAAGCGGSAGAEPAAKPPPPRAAAPPPAPARKTCVDGVYQRLETWRVAYGAAVRTRAVAYVRPHGRPLARFGRLNVNRVPTVFGVVGARLDSGCRPAWYRVRLPRKPNGSMGWVRAADVEVASVRTRILVDLSERRVTMFRDGRRVLTTRAAIGSPATPTPTGSYYVNQRLVPSHPHGPFGPGAIGISSFSEVLTGWTQGGPIAIHGTNRPDLIGQAVSNGCIRVRNDVLRRLFRVSIGGTPVVVRA
jgi:lipoprotein-anchoring transpeptidase ErfK/SrfK